MSRTVIRAAVGGLACMVLLVATAGAQDTSKCLSGKLKAISKKESGLLSCLSKVAAKNDPGFQAPCETSVKGKFGPAFAKADALGPCSGDMTACENNADACENDVGAAIPGTGACPAGALKAAGKLAGGELTCHAKAAKAGDPTLAPPCISSAETKFQAAVAKANGSSTCVADPSSLQNMIESDCIQAQVTLDGSGQVTALCGQSAQASCNPIVPGKPIANTYQLSGIAGPKLCTARATTNQFGPCNTDADCGGRTGTCIQTP